MAERIETEATILAVADDATWKFSIEAEIPAFDGDRSYRYIAWNKKQGAPPAVNSTVLGTFEPYQRAKFYVQRGDIEDGPVDGTETQYMLTWNMVGARPLQTGNGAGSPATTAPAASGPVRGGQGPSMATGATYLPAPTADERLAKELAKFRRESEGVNDRKAVSDVMAMVEAGAYTLDGLIEDSERLAAWYNTRLAARCQSPLVQAAQASGAVITNVKDEEPPVVIRNRPDLDDYVRNRGWASADISRIIQDAGYASSTEYLEAEGNTVQGLAALLDSGLGSW